MLTARVHGYQDMHCQNTSTCSVVSASSGAVPFFLIFKPALVYSFTFFNEFKFQHNIHLDMKKSVATLLSNLATSC